MTTAIEARERPILFSGAMVRAILEGKKTQTRRVVFTEQARRHDKAHRECWGADGYDVITASGEGLCRREWRPDLIKSWVVCPYGQPGDRLWVRETWCDTLIEPADDTRVADRLDERGYTFTAYRADNWFECPAEDGCWRPAIHMPRFRSRLLLDVLNIRVERLQEISEADAKTEGAPLGYYERETLDGLEAVPTTYRAGFRTLWDEINGARPGCSWEHNPWVWVVEFRRVTP